MSTAGHPGADAIDGQRAWTIAVAVAVAAALCFGTAYSFGTFFRHIADEFGAGRGAVATMFGVTIFLFFGLGAISGPLSDRLGPRRLLVPGAVLIGAGLVLTSLVHALWLAFVTYGLGVGVGCGLYVTPAFAVVGAWFQRSRALALGVASAGGGLGTLILVPAASWLIDAHGWRTTYAVMGAVDGVVLLATAAVIARPPVAAPRAGGRRLAHVGRDRTFRLLFVSGLLMSVALFMSFAFLVPFAEDQGITPTAAAWLVAIIGAASVSGRLVLSGLTRRFGPLRLYQACVAVQPLAYVVWMVAGDSYGLLVLFAVILGVSYGGYVALAPTVAAAMFGVIGLGGVLGLLYLGGGLGGLVGPPVGGALADSSGQTAAIAVSLAVTVVAAVVTLRIPARSVEDQPGSAVVREVVPGPVHEHVRPVAEADQQHEVQPEPS